MYTNKLIFLGFVLLIIPGVVFAQNSTNTPYTRYGYGVLADKAFISQRGMGGIGYGLRNPEMINPMNPASFSSIDSMTFMFDLGLTGQTSWLKDDLNKERKINGNLEYIAMQFLVAKKLGIGAGFEPVSYVGYNFADTTHLPVDNSLVHYIYTGRGGFSRVYSALAYDFFNRVSLGVKLSYMFGDITRDILETKNSSTIYDFTETDTVRAYGLLCDFGFQYHQSVGKFRSITVGVVYSPKIRFKANAMKGLIQSDPSTGISNVLESTVSRDSVFELPESFGVGFTYSRLGKITAGADILYQKWANAMYFNQTGAFNNRLKLNAGVEYIPNRTSNNLLSRIRYRTGLYHSNSYLKIKETKYDEYGLNLGLGIPMPDRRPNQQSFLSLAFEYSVVRPQLSNFISEQYFKVSLSYTFNESWFFKRKVQ